jgi:hypothetical protein
MQRAHTRRSIAAALLAAVLSLAGPAAAQTTSNASLFALICATSIGFNGLDRDTCGTSVLDESGGLGGTDPDDRKTDPGTLTLESLVANALAGNPIAGAIVRVQYAGGVALPLIRLNQDPCDALLANGGGSCGPALGESPAPVFPIGVSPSLNQTLTDEQEALLGCGPLWGTNCEIDGIDLTRAEASVLLQSWPGFEGTTPAARFENGELRILPGARGPGDAGYAPRVDGCTAPGAAPECALVQPLASPTDVFRSEMAALSWNLLMTLVAFSTPGSDGSTTGAFVPSDPMSTAPAQCSYAQPQYCSSVIAFLQAAPEPSSALAGLAALGALVLRVRRSLR